MVLSDESTSPNFSIGKSKRKPLYLLTDTPGPIYQHKGRTNAYFEKPPAWKIGRSQRPPLINGEIYEYAKYKYDEKDDLSKIKKRWDNIIGGSCTLAKRVGPDLYDNKPGPGRYDPNFNSRSQSLHSPSYVLGLKTEHGSSFNLNSGSGKNVAPWTYKQDNYAKLSQHRDFPSYSFQRAVRKDLAFKPWTKKESYYLYSSLGQQIMTQKPTLPIQSMPKETREGRLKTGVFKSMMERTPPKVRIEMPKF